MMLTRTRCVFLHQLPHFLPALFTNSVRGGTYFRWQKIIDRATSSIDYVNDLEGSIKDVVGRVYVQGFKYAQGKELTHA
jgi:hypothetical protein